MSASVVIYTTPWCPFCIRAKRLLDSKNAPFHEIDVAHAPEQRRLMEQKSGRRTVPQIWIGNRHIGGCDELYELERRGQLDALLNLTAGN